MAKQRFEITMTKKAVIELDDAVITTVDDAWRKQLYNIRTPEEIAKMVGGGLLDGCRLSQLDGWADQPDENAKIVRLVDEEIEAERV